MSAQILAFPQRHTPDGQVYEPWVDEPTIARHFQVSPRTVRRWRDGGMPSQLIGGSRRYKIGACENWHERSAAS